LRGELKQEKAQKVPELQELEQLQAQVTKVSTKPHGELVVTLENGQVWTEIQTNSGARVKAGDRVTIKPGALGSFLLAAPNGRSTRVTRVR
jgi:FKBP-type peptidyl-prolyl cis-trans isomerase